MHCIILAIGKWKAGPQKALFEHYAQRSPWKITLRELDPKKPLQGDALKQKEAELLLDACEGIDALWALDETGSEITSAALSQKLSTLRDNGSRTLGIVIGGASGLHASVRHRMSFTLSLGRCTWPHLLVRGLIAEQLYRAQMILSGHPYHRE